MYIDVLRRLRDAARRKGPLKVDDQQSVFPSQQCSSTPVDFVQGFLSQEQCDTTGAYTLLTWLQQIFICPSTEISIEEEALL